MELVTQLQQALGKLLGKLNGWFDTAVMMLPNFLLAVLFFGVVLLASQYLRKWSLRLISKVSHNRAVNKLLSTILTVVFVALGIFVALSILNLDKAVTSLLAGAGVVGLAVGLAFQEPIVNTISGIIMSVDKPFNLNDLVSTNDYFGTIEKITLRATHLRLLSGEKVVIPNKQVVQEPFTNFTIHGSRRVEIECGISYGDDLEKVKEVALKAIRERVDHDDSRPVDFYYSEFGSSSINFDLRFWNDLCAQPDYLAARDQAIIALKQAFDEASITIPFPIRTLDFGIKGGKAVGPALQQVITARSRNGDAVAAR